MSESAVVNEPGLIRAMRHEREWVAEVRAAVPGGGDAWVERVKMRAERDASRTAEIVRQMLPEILRMQQLDAQAELRTLTARAKRIAPETVRAEGEPCS